MNEALEQTIENLKKFSRTPSFQTANVNIFLKFSSLLGGGWVDICPNEEMSPSPSALLFDASAQSPPRDKTVETVWSFTTYRNSFFLKPCAHCLS